MSLRRVLLPLLFGVAATSAHAAGPGTTDWITPAEAAVALAMTIPGARLVPSPWSGEEFMDVLTGKGVGAVFDLYPRLVPQIRAFTATLKP